MTDNLKLFILDVAMLILDITLIIALIIISHKGEKKNMNKDLKPGTFSGVPKDYETSITNEIDLGKSDGKFDTIYINTNHCISKDKIDLKGRFDKVNKIIIDGVTFVREEKK